MRKIIDLIDNSLIGYIIKAVGTIVFLISAYLYSVLKSSAGLVMLFFVFYLANFFFSLLFLKKIGVSLKELIFQAIYKLIAFSLLLIIIFVIKIEFSVNLVSILVVVGLMAEFDDIMNKVNKIFNGDKNIYIIMKEAVVRIAKLIKIKKDFDKEIEKEDDKNN